MKKRLCILLSIIMLGCFSGCKTNENTQNGGATDGTHTHEYTLVLPKKPTCTEKGNSAYYICECGKIFTKKGTIYVETTPDTVSLNPTGHIYAEEKVSDEYFLSEATETTPQIFAKSCISCGEKSESDTFTYGKTLAEYKNEDKSLYAPNCLTMSLYNAAHCIYGFTWNTETEPARPVLNIKNKADGEEQSIRADFIVADSYSLENGKDQGIKYYSCKAKISLEPSTEYLYSVGDKYLNVYTETTEIKTVNSSQTESWRFVHVSDSQVEGDVNNGGIGTGKEFSYVLKNVSTLSDVKFIVHTGDVVEYSKYQSYWVNMLNENFNYLSKIPVMAISGNHETTYKCGTNETFNRFYYDIPQQETDLGFYYSFSYGNVKFLMLNTNRLNGTKLTSDQYSWLENELKNKTEKWTIVAMHNPMYSVGKWGSDPGKNAVAVALANQLNSLFVRYKVDVVLQGHDHMVSRTHPLNYDGAAVKENRKTINGTEYIEEPNGVIYVMNGPAGNQARNEIYNHDDSLYAYAKRSRPSSWAEFEVSQNLLTVTVKTANSGTAEKIISWGIKKK